MQEEDRTDHREDEERMDNGQPLDDSFTSFLIRCLSIALLELATTATATATWNDYHLSRPY
jgi:hypothetical protein